MMPPRPPSPKKDFGAYFDQVSVSAWLGAQEAPLRGRFHTYVDEAFFFFGLLMRRSSLERSIHLLDVGGGIGLLSLLLASTGKKVVCVEPESAGFGSHKKIREVLLSAWKGELPDVTYLDGRLEDYPDLDRDFDSAVAIMVVEHVPDYPNLIGEIMDHLRPGAKAHFICPNYALPYEPHFNIPTAFSKKLTEFFIGSQLGGTYRGIEDSRNFWDDLSWPTHRAVRKVLESSPLSPKFGREASFAYVDRLGSQEFLARKGPIFRVMGLFSKLLKFVAKVLPLSLLPIIDVSVASEPSTKANG
jgi:SAM-dependent methyltransferase